MKRREIKICSLRKMALLLSYFITYSNTFGAQCSQSPDKQKLRATRRDEKKAVKKKKRPNREKNNTKAFNLLLIYYLILYTSNSSNCRTGLFSVHALL